MLSGDVSQFSCLLHLGERLTKNYLLHIIKHIPKQTEWAMLDILSGGITRQTERNWGGFG